MKDEILDIATRFIVISLFFLVMFALESRAVEKCEQLTPVGGHYQMSSCL